MKFLNYSYIAFIMMFFAETTYYLLILQTGIVEFYNSNMQLLWMIPVGGVLGIILTFKLKNYQHKVLSISLFFQILLVSLYPDFNSVTLFVLGLLSGLVAPILIYQIKELRTVFIVLSLSYVVGTFGILTPTQERFPIAIVLSILAFASSLFVHVVKHKENTNLITIVDFVIIFFWLLLDSTLFESLSRDAITIWKNSEFVWIIAFSHLLGLVLAYKLHSHKRVNLIVIGLFALSFMFYYLKLQYPLSVVYPVIISFYNVIILKRFIQLPFLWLSFGTISLWASAGIGLLTAIGEFYALGWAVLIVLLFLQHKGVADVISMMFETAKRHIFFKDIK